MLSLLKIWVIFYFFFFNFCTVLKLQNLCCSLVFSMTVCHKYIVFRMLNKWCPLSFVNLLKSLRSVICLASYSPTPALIILAQYIFLYLSFNMTTKYVMIWTFLIFLFLQKKFKKIYLYRHAFLYYSGWKKEVCNKFCV